VAWPALLCVWTEVHEKIKGDDPEHLEHVTALVVDGDLMAAATGDALCVES